MERTDALAASKGVSLRSLAPLLGLSVASLFGYRSGNLPISRKGWSKLEQAELEMPSDLKLPQIANNHGKVEEIRAPWKEIGTVLRDEPNPPIGTPDAVPPTRLAESQGPSSHWLQDSQSRTIPVLSWALAELGEHFHRLPGDWDDRVATDCEDAQAFAVRMEGDSMEPRYLSGDVLILAPDSPVTDGCLAVMKLAEGGFVFRRIEHRPGILRLIPLNNDWPSEELATDAVSWIFPVWGMVRKVMR